ncbi:HAD-IIA family hydrolase [bacterium]|nr:MAG: HAD-IIA family hydrolase [bacterium]
MKDQIKALILDMDGVLWRDTEAIGNLPEIFNKINELGLKFTFATNNSTRDEQQYIAKLKSFGIEAKAEHIINSSIATAEILKEKFPQGGNLFIIGEPGLINTLERYGFSHSVNQPLCVVVGMDRQVTYDIMSKAALLIQKGIPFIGTNPDRSFPTPEGQTIGTGAILAAIEAATGITPTICGKPYPQMMKLALSRMGTLPEETLAVGDRYETDIVGGIRAGCQTALVLSGVTSAEQVSGLDPKPNYIFQDLSELVHFLEANGKNTDL